MDVDGDAAKKEAAWRTLMRAYDDHWTPLEILAAVAE